jgi:hypothetical protein
MTIIAKKPDRLFELLPALYRIADADRNNELRALLRLITKEADALRDDTQQLWDDSFIETCQRWVIPYIGDLVGNIPLHDLDLSSAAATAEARFTDLAGPDLKPPGAIRLRADVAKTIYYRRRKGTPPMLEELARDVTGWDAHVVEFFTLLDWNQHLEHLRLECHGCPDLRRVDVGDRAGGPWDITTHTVDVRRINEWDGWYNIPNIGFFLWRLEAFRLTRITPRAIGGTNWRLTFSPLGQDIPLFSAGRREPGESRMATELTIELPIRAAAFFEDLATVPVAPPPTPSTAYYGDPATTQASLVVFENGMRLTADQVECTNLENWTAFAQPSGTVVRIDPTRGRLAIPTGRAGSVTVSYLYGFSMEIGGGEYDRAKWMVPSPPPLPVAGGGLALNSQIAARPPAPRTVIEIQDDATYLLNADITLAANESLALQAADGARPHVQLANGSIAIQTLGSGASLTLSGLLIEGGLRVEGDLRTLRLLHTTMVPGRSVEQENPGAPTGFSLEVAPGPANAQLNTELEVQMAFSIVGALRIPSHITQLLLLDSIVVGIDRLDGPWIPAVCDAADTSGPPAHIERSTLLGTSRFLKLELASESIFTSQVMVDQRQQGCVRFSFVPFDSQTPQQYRCQPALEIAEEKERRKAAAAASGIPLPAGWEALVEAEIVQWLVPSFQTDRYGRPDFVQLRRTCPTQIRTGAADGSEMGVFCVLKQPQRESNLRIRLDEYLPVGLEAGLIYVT